MGKPTDGASSARLMRVLMFCAQLCLVAAISNIDVTPASAQEQLCGFDSAQNFVCGPGTKVVPTIPDKYTAIALSSDRRFFWGFVGSIFAAAGRTNGIGTMPQASFRLRSSKLGQERVHCTRGELSGGSIRIRFRPQQQGGGGPESDRALPPIWRKKLQGCLPALCQ
jgi:hypothetical protein